MEFHIYAETLCGSLAYLSSVKAVYVVSLKELSFPHFSFAAAKISHVYMNKCRKLFGFQDTFTMIFTHIYISRVTVKDIYDITYYMFYPPYITLHLAAGRTASNWENKEILKCGESFKSV